MALKLFLKLDPRLILSFNKFTKTSHLFFYVLLCSIWRRAFSGHPNSTAFLPEFLSEETSPEFEGLMGSVSP